MSIYIIAFAATAITCSVVGSFVLFKNFKSPINSTWFLLSLFVAIYCLFFCFHVTANTQSSATIYSKLLSVGSIFASPFFFIFTLHLTRKYSSYKIFAKISLGLATFFLMTLWGGLFFEQSRAHNVFSFFAVPGPLYPVFLFYFFINTFAGHIILIRSIRSVSSLESIKIKYMLLASCVAFLAASTTFLTAYGISGFEIVSLFLPLYPVIVSIAIVKHQLMEIEVIIKRTAVFAGLFVFVYSIFSVFAILAQGFFKSSFGSNPWLATVPIVLIITLALRPLEIFLTNATDRFLFQKKYDYRVLLRTFSNEILTILDLQKLLDQTALQLVRILKLDCASVLLHQKDEKSYTIVAAAGLKEKDVVFHEDDLLIRSLEEGHHPIQKDKTAEKVSGDGRLKEDFKKIRANLCLPIMLHDELIGVLALGMKKSGDDYTPEDVDILSTLARTEAIAISNAQLFDELSKTQAEAAQREKMAVIGTLAAGINHEICNPLGIVRGQCEMFLLNMRDGLYHDKTPEQLIQISSDIMTKVIKETDRATGITKKLSSFAKPSRKNEAEEVSVSREVEEILGLLGHDLKLSNIDFRFNLPKDFPGIMVDRKQFQEVLFNIIRNAAQAMDKKSGFIEIGGLVEHGYAAIKITDNGMGIPREKINQIFNPFFTTKAPGKGTGLGLFIVKQVVERNKGTIEVESIDGEGTSFVLRFPAASKLAVV